MYENLIGNIKIMPLKLNKNNFIQKSKKIHNNKYDYSNSIYTGIDNKLLIICSLRGKFYQTPYHHINRRQGCPKCGRKKLYLLLRSDNKEFINKAKKIIWESDWNIFINNKKILSSIPIKNFELEKEL